MLTLAQWILRLTKGYIRHTGKQPDGLAKLKIKLEAAQKVRDQSKVVQGDFNPNEEWWKARPTKATPFSSPQTPQEKIDWLVKNVSQTAETGIPPKATLEAMLKDGRGDLIDHFYDLFTKKLGGPPKINIDTSGLKHPELVKKMMMDKKLKPTLVKETEAEILARMKGMNKKTIERIKRRRYEAAIKAEKAKAAKDPNYIPDVIDPEDFASGGIAGELHLNRPGYKSGLLAKLFKLKKKKSEPKEFIWGVGGKKIDVADLKKKHGLDEASLKKDEEAFKLRLQQILAKHSTKHATGGRVSYTKGGLAKILGV